MSLPNPLSCIESELSQVLGTPIARVARESGGDINCAFRVELGDGTRVFVKTHPNAPGEMFRAEAEGLAFLKETKGLRVPQVLAVGSGQPGFLAMEDLGKGVASPEFDEELGRGLARLHRCPAPVGLERSNWIGSLPQSNRWEGAEDDWAGFYGACRVLPLVERAETRGLLGPELGAALRELVDRLPDLVGPLDPLGRLHGDLWSGNVHVADTGEPCLIDPAVYGGHREVDLAMMRLFGGFSSRVFSAYEEHYPLPEGAAARVPLYQLYPLLVHVCLFGSSYVERVRRAVGSCLMLAH